MEMLILEKELIGRLYWLIRLRWIAQAGVVLTVLFATYILKFPLPTFPVYAIVILLGVYNIVFFLLLNPFSRLSQDSDKTKKKEESLTTINRVANAQISLDLVSLVLLIHFSGGIENPFILYFIFHMIIASTLLSRRASFLQATFAIFLFCLIVIPEYLGILPHYCLKGFIIYDQHKNLIYITGVFFVFMSTLYIAVYLATSIASRLRQRERSLEETNVLLKEKDRLKSEYVLRVSHDIKEHLAAIQGCLEPVMAGITGGLNSQQFDLIQRAVQRTAKLMFFVKALLEITRIKLSKEIKMDYFSFKDVLCEAITYIDSKAKDKDITLNSIVEPSIDKIRGAKEYIHETITNLLANSVKYTPRNGRIDIKVSDKGNSIFIQIKDTGIGIPKDELPRIFEEFYRASNAKETERDGTGLGLSITKQIVERHKGKIWVESEEGKGSIFTIELPK